MTQPGLKIALARSRWRHRGAGATSFAVNKPFDPVWLIGEPPDHEADLAAACFAGYVAGLREAGWAGDERLARLGFAADAALRHSIGLLREILPLVSDPARRRVAEDRFGRPLDDVVTAWAELWPLQLGLAEEAQALLPAIG